MSFLKKLKRVNRVVSVWIERIGLMAFLFVLCITCVDVIGGKVFNKPVFGGIDMVMLAQFTSISFAASMMVILGRHIQVDFAVILLPKGWRNVLRGMTHFLCFLFFVLIVWRLFAFGYSLQTGGEVTPTAYIPIYPFVYGAAFACVPACLGYLQQSIELILRVVTNES
ncbi:MAG: TRAP transporter small permease [Deltaproteobacteria bacterium]|nr:TRAP transporter small permease [Deltaproteobacteria bacterium]